MAERWQREMLKLRRVQLPHDLWDRVEAGPQMSPVHESRRTRVAAIALALGLFAGLVASLWAALERGHGQPGWLPGSDTLTVPAIGRVVPEFLADGHPVFVVHRHDGSVIVVDAFSTHTGAGLLRKLVAWCPSSRTFDDVEHGSKFNEFGTWLLGPAPTGLVTYRFRDAPGEPPSIKVLEALPPAPRGAGPAGNPVGPFCVDSSRTVFHTIPADRVWDSPKHAVEAAPTGWIAVRGVLVQSDGQSPRLCQSVQAGSCQGGAVTDLLEVVPPIYLEWSMWLARVQGGRLVDLTLPVPGGIDTR